jgi:hypothetical protein
MSQYVTGLSREVFVVIFPWKPNAKLICVAAVVNSLVLVGITLMTFAEERYL